MIEGKTKLPQILVDDTPRSLEFRCHRVYDIRRYTAKGDQAFITQYHLQKWEDSHTLCGYKTDLRKIGGRWTNASQAYYADTPAERDTMCFRCLRIWALKNQIQYPRQWMLDRTTVAERTEKELKLREEVEE